MHKKKQLTMQDFLKDEIPEPKTEDLSKKKCRDCQYITYIYEDNRLVSIKCFQHGRDQIDPDDPICNPEQFSQKRKRINPRWDKKQRKFLTTDESEYHSKYTVQNIGEEVKVSRPLKLKTIKKKKRKKNKKR
jgi:hypothetical protein